ncbi:MAG: hydrogen gas-evolving membrane-bound hydrogenase subunit E [Desertimonas sp.]
MTTLLLVHLAVGLGLLAIGPRTGRAAYLAAGAPMLATLVWLAARLPDIVDGGIITQRVPWIPQLGLGLDLRLDGFGAVMVTLIAGIGVLVVAYADGYFHPRGARSARLMGLLVLFAGSMLGLVVADNLLVLYGFWELTSITSFLLIGNNSRSASARAAALQALLITGMGGLAMLGGFIIVGQAAGTYRLSALVADPPGSSPTVIVALALILLGAFTKSAQFPFHSWLPGAMVAPTPISAYLHSATMVKAGVYLVARLAPAFAVVGMWRPVVVTVGAVTMIGGALRAIRQTDLKLLLAMGTISQLGFMMVVVGWGSAEASMAGAVLLLAHGLFKAGAFMVVGILDHHLGTRDVRRIARPSLGWAPTIAAGVVAAASMAGVPLLFGFIAKEAVFEALLHAGTGGAVALAALVVGSALTVAYSVRFVLGSIGALHRDDDLGDEPAPERHVVRARAPRGAFAAPTVLLAILSVVLGLRPGVVDGLVGAATDALTRVGDDAVSVHLALWHGVNSALGLSVLALTAGAVIAVVVAGRRHEPAWVTRVGDGAGRLPSSNDAYRGSLRLLNETADRVTSISQPGSLPIYLGVILVTAVVVPLGALLTRPWWRGFPRFLDNPLHLGVVALVLGFAAAATAVRRRFSAALFLSMAGYGMAALFLVHGAPDLALTQVAIETLTTVLFVLVLRRLPDRFESNPVGNHRRLRLIVAAAVGTGVFLFTMAVAGSDDHTGPTAVSDVIVAEAYPEANGRNVVNVILVDFRGLDTLGELTVLAAAAIGTVALARAGRRAGADPVPTPPPVTATRLVTVDVAVRVVFAAIVLGSWWLLFAGHNQPGGGFVGGIVAGAAVSLRYVSGGLASVRKISRGRPWMVLGSGLLISALAALAPLLFGGSVLESDAWTWEAPVVGTIKLTSPLFFDIGVYLAVVGLALMVFESFGDDPAPGEPSTVGPADVATREMAH